MKLNENLNIFTNGSDLYLSGSDIELIKVSGEDSQNLISLIKILRVNSSIDEAYNKFRDKVMDDRAYFDTLIEYLKGSNVLKGIPLKNNGSKNVIVIGSFDKYTAKDVFDKYFQNIDGVSLKLIKILNPLDLTAEEIISFQCDLIILFSPIYLSTPLIKYLSQHLYKNNITCFHLGLEYSRLTIGPLLDSNLSTPTLSCYIARKLAGSAEPKNLVTFSKISEKSMLNSINLLKNPYIDALLSLMRNELSNYYAYSISSRIVARENEIDFASYSANQVKIFKTKHYYDLKSSYKPFNG